MKTQKQAALFLLVGGLNTLVGYGLYAAFIFTGLEYPWAVLFATLAGILFNFKTTGKLVFNNTDNSLFVKFAMVYILIYFFNMAVIKSMQLLTANLYLAGFAAMIPAAIMAFVLNKLIVFKDVYETN